LPLNYLKTLNGIQKTTVTDVVQRGVNLWKCFVDRSKEVSFGLTRRMYDLWRDSKAVSEPEETHGTHTPEGLYCKPSIY
jgi:hypothetical protein